MDFEEVDLDLDNYSLYDLLDLFGFSINQKLQKNELQKAVENLKEMIITDEDGLGVDSDGDEQEQEEGEENSQDRRNELLEFVENAGKKMIELVNSVNQEDANAEMKETYCVYSTLDSRFRENMDDPTDSFDINPSDDLENVTSISLVSAQIPLSWFAIDPNKGNNFFYLGLVEHIKPCVCCDGSGACCDGSGACCDGSGACCDGSGACCDGSGACCDGSGACCDGSGACCDGSGACCDGSGACCDGSGACCDGSGACCDGSGACCDGSGACCDGSGACCDGSGSRTCCDGSGACCDGSGSGTCRDGSGACCDGSGSGTCCDLSGMGTYCDNIGNDIEDMNVIHGNVYSRGDYIEALRKQMEALDGIVDGVQNTSLSQATRESNCRKLLIRNNYDTDANQTGRRRIVWRRIIIDSGNYLHNELVEEIQEKINLAFADVTNLSGEAVFDISDPDPTNHRHVAVTYETTKPFKNRIAFENKMGDDPEYTILVRLYDPFGNQFVEATENTCLGYLMGWRNDLLLQYLAIQISQHRVGNGDSAETKDGGKVEGTTTPNVNGPNAIYVGVEDHANYSRRNHIGSALRDKILNDKTDCYIKEFIRRKINGQTQSQTLTGGGSSSNDGGNGNGSSNGSGNYVFEEDFLYTNDTLTSTRSDQSSFTPKQQEAIELKLSQLEAVIENKRKNGNLDNDCKDCKKQVKDDPAKILARISVDVPPVAVKELGYVQYRNFNSGAEDGSFTRDYIGPVTLTRMNVFLMDENGCRINLNDQDMSITMKICRSRLTS